MRPDAERGRQPARAARAGGKCSLTPLLLDPRAPGKLWSPSPAASSGPSATAAAPPAAHGALPPRYRRIRRAQPEDGADAQSTAMLRHDRAGAAVTSGKHSL
ncbi:hypothetical protein H8959_019897 [Pygathrix nigripes]